MHAGAAARPTCMRACRGPGPPRAHTHRAHACIGAHTRHMQRRAAGSCAWACGAYAQLAPPAPLQVAILFKYHNDLLTEFTYFLPDNTPQQQQHVSACTAGACGRASRSPPGAAARPRGEPLTCMHPVSACMQAHACTIRHRQRRAFKPCSAMHAHSRPAPSRPATRSGRQQERGLPGTQHSRTAWRWCRVRRASCATHNTRPRADDACVWAPALPACPAAWLQQMSNMQRVPNKFRPNARPMFQPAPAPSRLRGPPPMAGPGSPGSDMRHAHKRKATKNELGGYRRDGERGAAGRAGGKRGRGGWRAYQREG
jgi:hypothetical protein